MSEDNKLIEFSSSTCGVCKKMAPVINKLVEETNLNFTLYNVDNEDNADLAEKWKVTTLPSFIHLKDGQEVGRAFGFQTVSALKELLHLNKYC